MPISRFYPVVSKNPLFD